MGKYPTPEEIVSKYKRGVSFARDKYVREATEAADKDLFVWYSVFTDAVYDVIAGLPEKATGPDAFRTNLLNRSLPVIEKIHEASTTYRKAKVTAMKKKSEASKGRAESILGIKIEEVK
jgi:hypothetical protein